MQLLWLGERRGALTDWVTQQWVRLTGRRLDLSRTPWLEGPVGPVQGIGPDFLETWARQAGWEVQRSPPALGLLPNAAVLGSAQLDPGAIHPMVRDFYERTSGYELEAWGEWSGAFRPFGRILALLFSRRLRQLNLPLDPLDTSHGMSSEVFHLANPGTGAVAMAAWIRHLRRTGRVLYAGAYSVCQPPGHSGPCVRVVFPLPNGNAVVILRPEVDPQGALVLTSSGRAFGDPGFYFTVQPQGGGAWARHVRSMRESIRVFVEDTELRADHVLSLWGRVFLRLHYRMRPVPPTPGSPGT